MQQINLHFDEYSPNKFLALVETLCRGGALPPAVSDPELASDQARYLANYIGRDLKAKSVVVEVPYIDRHYIEEYAGYYAKTLRPPSPHAARMHFFKAKCGEAELKRTLQDVSEGSWTPDKHGRLNESYLGFVVVRPLPDSPIGRTVLRTISDDGQCVAFARQQLCTTHTLRACR